MSCDQPKTKSRKLQLAVAIPLAAAGLSACGSSSSGGSPAVSPASSASSSPGTSFSTANITGLGTVVVDGRGRTVYILTAPGKKNVPCEDSNGCTAIWPDLPLPAGTTSATAGNGIKASLLGTMRSSDGETYPTYNGYLMYEYAPDSGPGQAHGQGAKTFGGTWWVLSPSGKPITSGGAASASNPSSSSSSGGGGYGY